MLKNSNRDNYIVIISVVIFLSLTIAVKCRCLLGGSSHREDRIVISRRSISSGRSGPGGGGPGGGGPGGGGPGGGGPGGGGPGGGGPGGGGPGGGGPGGGGPGGGGPGGGGPGGGGPGGGGPGGGGPGGGDPDTMPQGMTPPANFSTPLRSPAGGSTKKITRTRRRTTPNAVEFSDPCEFQAMYCIEGYKTGKLCARSPYYQYYTFDNYCVFDYINCINKWDIWYVAYMGDCINATVDPKVDEYMLYPAFNDYFMDNMYVITE